MSNTSRKIVVALVALIALCGVTTGAWMGARSLTKPKTPVVRPTHRPVAVTCKPSSRGERKRNPGLHGCDGDDDCKDAAEGKNGRCVETVVGHARFENKCQYDACSTNQDCRRPPGGDPLTLRWNDKGPCICGEDGWPNRCSDGNCSTDSECAGRQCSPSLDFSCGGGGREGYYCHTSGDLCSNDGDCRDDAGFAGGRQCRYDLGNKRWACTSSSCRSY